MAFQHDHGDGPAGGALPARAPAERRTVLALIALYWLGFQAIYFGYFAITRPGFPSSALLTRHDIGTLLVEFARFFVRPSELTICLLGAVLCYAIFLAVKSLRRWPFAAQLAGAVLIIIAGAAALSVIAHAVTLAMGLDKGLTPRLFALEILIFFAPIGLWTGTALAISYNNEIRARERQLAFVQAQAHEAQMRALRFQVNPHFLYNTLNSISALILDRRNDDAERMVLALSAFFRTTIAADPLQDVDLTDEIALQKLYLDIEKIRFPDRLDVSIDIPSPLARARVPGLILQPIVENALKHGVGAGGERMRLNIAARREADRLIVEVQDDGPAASVICPSGTATGTGVGLANVGNRLAARFGAGASVQAAPDDAGFTVRLTMPLEYA